VLVMHIRPLEGSNSFGIAPRGGIEADEMSEEALRWSWSENTVYTWTLPAVRVQNDPMAAIHE
jgi:hypothetical protein